ncbi:MAG: response regulator [Proteobacteria bacterium]|nr:response regulator [Pseudomonadota bacterium]
MKQILLVDDSHFFIQAIRAFLERSGNCILTAECGREALNVLESSSPDLILMDYYLNDISGDECCRKIKSDPATKDIPIIMFTSAGNTKNIEMSKSAGCDDYITKPVDKMALLTKIKRYLAIPTREHKRAPICVPAFYYHNNRKHSGMIFCISEGGVFIKDNNIPENGSIIQISFSIPQIAGNIEVKAETAWNTTERKHLPAGIGPGFGVRFLSIDEERIEAIRTYVGLGDYLL